MNEKKYCTMITGACGGLGRAFVKLLAKKQENLVLVGTNREKLDKLLADFYAELNGLFVQTFVCDLSDKKSREDLIGSINKNNIIINKLINNAGVIIEGDILRLSNEEIEKTIQVNCIGTLELTKRLVEARDETKKFEILTISSQSAFQPIPHMSLYAGTKSFLTSMMLALKYEWKDKNIVVTTLCPSGMATTKEMQDSIKSMGFKGKITTLSTQKVAKAGLRALDRKKAIVIPGFINKLAYYLSKLCSPYFLAKTTGKMWKKSQDKRGF